MNLRAVFYLLGRLLFIFSGFLLIPSGVSVFFGETELLRYFILTVAFALGLGCLFFLFFRSAAAEGIGLREGFLLVTLSWLLLSLLGSIPFFLSGFFPNFIDAFFETTSGLTTTGASVLANIEALPKGLLFWRSFTHWIGGMGIIVLAVAILPQLSIGGMQLLKNETPGPTFEQLKPRIKQTALSLWKIYILFSVLQTVLLRFFGMSWFDSFCHMFGTMGTGGFSTHSASLAYFESPWIQGTVILFMFLAGMNFVLHHAYLRGDFRKVLRDTEWRFYVSVLVCAFVLITWNLVTHTQGVFGDTFLAALFQVVAITTTTGYVTADFNAWPELARGILFLLMFTGGCAGSTSGGIKQVRWLLLLKRAKQAITQHIFPQAVVPVKLNKRVIPEHVLHGVSSFLLIYIVLFAACTSVLLAFDLDVVTSTSAVVACLSNIGPGFGSVGAVENYAFLPSVVKLVLCACMIIGRLEIFTVLVLFFPATWRR